jgi:hypothetical protein
MLAAAGSALAAFLSVAAAILRRGERRANGQDGESGQAQHSDNNLLHRNFSLWFLFFDSVGG